MEVIKIIEIICTICGLIQGLLILLKRKENWIFYLLNISTLIIYSFCAHLYGDVIENCIYLTIGIFGTFAWMNNKFAKRFNTEKIRHASKNENIVFLLAILILSAITYCLIFNSNDPLPSMDSITTGMGFVATFMMACKIIETWIVWFIDDILMLCVYLSLPEPGYALAMLNFVWIFMAIGSYISWKKEIEYEEV